MPRSLVVCILENQDGKPRLQWACVRRIRRMHELLMIALTSGNRLGGGGHSAFIRIPWRFQHGHDEGELMAKQEAVRETLAHDGERRLPLITRIYGVLVLIASLVTLPSIVAVVIYEVRNVVKGRLVIDALSLTFILSCVQVVMLVANASCLAVFGVALVRNHRRHAARWAYVLMPLTIVEGMLSLALDGLGLNLAGPFVRLVILVALSITLDPALRAERRLQYTIKRIDERVDYDKAVQDGMLGRDVTGKGYIALDFFNIFWLFVVGSVFGLAIETVYHIIVSGGYEDRAGLLWGPFSPIYGCGAAILTVCLNRLWKSNPLLIFFASAVIGGAFEYAVSWFMEAAFGIIAWDYTGQWLSIDGRTSGQYMIFWGLLGVLWIKLMLPQLLALINRIPWRLRYSLTTIFLILLLVDIIATLMALDCWYGRVAGSPQDSPATRFFGRHFDNGYMQARFQTMHIDPSKSGRV